MAEETRTHSLVVKATNSETHGILSFNGVAEAAGRPNVSIEVDPTLDTEDHTLTITNS